MARPLRLEYPGALYHVTARGNERKSIFRSDADRKAFLSILSQAVDRYRLVVHAYVLMQTHYHLLLETQEANLSLAMRHLNGVYTSYFNRTYRRAGHLFQGRFKAILVEKECYLLELSRYIHLNPVRMKKRVGLARYGWSSYRDYVGERRAPGWLHCEDVLEYFGRSRAQAQRAYRGYVEAGAKEGVERPWGRAAGVGGGAIYSRGPEESRAWRPSGRAESQAVDEAAGLGTDTQAGQREIGGAVTAEEGRSLEP
jgi:putative transposase